MVMKLLCLFVCLFHHQDAVCAEAVDENMCLKNPECSWCEGRCREYQPTNPVTLLSDFLLNCNNACGFFGGGIHFYIFRNLILSFSDCLFRYS